MVNKQTAAGPHITQHNTIETNLGMIHMACVYNIHCAGWGDLQNLGSLGSAEVFKCLLNLGSVLITLIRRLGRTIDMMQM